MKKICESCSKEYDTKIVVNGKVRYTSAKKRLFCFECSPFGTKDKRHPKDRTKDQDGCRTCSTCKQRKPLDKDNFGASKTDKHGFRWSCKYCSSKRVIRQQQSQKIRCLEYKGGKCEICGYNKSKRALHFHHVNPDEKDFSLAKYRTRSWETTKVELDKCRLVCANCHAELHDKLIEQLRP